MAATDTNGKKPAFEDVMLALDAVDTLLHQESVKLDELNSDQYKEALIAKMREYNLVQGREVSEEMLVAAAEQAEKDRLVFKAPKPGLELSLARFYVRRAVYGRRTALALATVAAVFVTGWFAYDYGIVKPREREIARIEQARVDEIARIEKLFGETLPKDLTLAAAEARDAAHTAGEDADVEAVNLIENRGKAAIGLRDEQEARRAIAEARSTTSGLKARGFIALLKHEAEDVSANAGKQSMDDNARKLVSLKLDALRQTAESGDGRKFNQLKGELANTLSFIRTPYNLRIVNRRGVNTYFWRFYKGDRSKRTDYVVVEALDAAGKPAAVDVMNGELSIVERVTIFAIRVPRERYDMVEADKKADGIVNNSEAGTKPAGSVDFKWSFPTVDGQMITRWETKL